MSCAEKGGEEEREKRRWDKKKERIRKEKVQREREDSEEIAQELNALNLLYKR